MAGMAGIAGMSLCTMLGEGRRQEAPDEVRKYQSRSDWAAKDKMSAAVKSWTLSIEQQELLVKPCFEGLSVLGQPFMKES